MAPPIGETITTIKLHYNLTTAIPQALLSVLIALLVGLPSARSTADSPTSTPAANSVLQVDDQRNQSAPVPEQQGKNQANGLAAPELESPTDQPPPEVPAPRPMHLGLRTIVAGAIDTRYRTANSGRTYYPWLQSAEVDVTYPIVNGGVTKGNIVLQALAENPPDIPRSNDVQFGEAYLIYKLPIDTSGDSTAYIKVGQFQIPFALLAVYDPHQLLVQPLYAQSLGLRNDWGVDLSGRFYTVLNYDFAITRGVGPSVIGQVDPTQVVTFRLGRTFYTRNGIINVGGSLLNGRLPNNDIDAEHPFATQLPPSGRVRAVLGYVNKSRIAGDGTLLFKRVTARAEAMAGADDDNKILGYYAEGEYTLSKRAGWLLARSFWKYPLGDSFSSDDQMGLTYVVSPNLTWRSLYESLRDKPRDSTAQWRHRFTIQLLLRF